MKRKLLALPLAGAVVASLPLAVILHRPRAPEPVPIPVPVPATEVAVTPPPPAVPVPTTAPSEPPPAALAVKPGPPAHVLEEPVARPGQSIPAKPGPGKMPCLKAGCDTPLVLSFDGAPIEYLADRAHAFDLNGAASRVTDWPTAGTPWLVLDRDGDGRIADGSELFGSMTVLSSGARAPQGFAALRELDADGDGRLTAADPAFARLLVWSDRDGDRRSSAGELAPLSAWGIVSIDLAFTSEPRCDDRGNCEVERASFVYRDASGTPRTGAVIDVHLAPQR